MTIALCIAATSEILRFIIEADLEQAGQSLGFTPPPVTIGPPPHGSEAEGPAINIFLYQASPNSTLRNVTGFVRGPIAARRDEPATLDLGYLISAHGVGPVREIGFASAIGTLQRTPVPPAASIRSALASLAGDTDSFRALLAGEDVANRIESLTVKPQALGLDSLAGLWSVIQTPLQPSATYLATIAFSEQETEANLLEPITTGRG